MFDYRNYLKSDYWNKFRKYLYKAFQYKCWFCESGDKELHVHHTKYYSTTLREGLKKGKNNTRWFLVLCRECHKQIHDLQRDKNVDEYTATKLYRNESYPHKRLWMTKKEFRSINRKLGIIKP